MDRTFDSYAEMEKAHQEDVNKFPIVWMFGTKTDEEMKECLSQIGAKHINECVGIPGGGMIRKADVGNLRKMFDKHERERKAFAKTEKNLYDMIITEMKNQEYGYTLDPEDTLLALGKTRDDLTGDSAFSRAWKKAEKACCR